MSYRSTAKKGTRPEQIIRLTNSFNQEIFCFLGLQMIFSSNWQRKTSAVSINNVKMTVICIFIRKKYFLKEQMTLM